MLQIHCAGEFAEHNAHSITGLATVLLAFVTAGLVWLGYEQSATTRAQLRAYIFVEHANIVDGATPASATVPASSGCPRSFIVIKNSGATPAYDVVHTSELVIWPITNLDSSSFPVPALETSKAPKSAIGPAGTTNANRDLGRALTPHEIAGLAAVGQVLVVQGHIHYKDAFGIARVTYYRLGYAGAYPVPLGVSLAFTATGNRAT